MAADWLEVNSSNIDSFCGEESGESLASAFDSVNAWWGHNTAEVHWFIIDLKQSLTITKVRGRSLRPADPVDVNIYVSDDKENFGTAVATGISTWQDTATWQEVDTTDKKGRYVKVEIEATELGSPSFISWGGTGASPIFDVYATDIPDIANIPYNLMNDEVGTVSESYVDCNFRIEWDGSKMDKIIRGTLIVNGNTEGEDSYATAQLWDFTNSAEIASIIFTGYGAKVSNFNSDNLPSGAAEIGMRIKLGTGTSCALRNAQLVVTLSAPDNGGSIKARIIREVGWVIEGLVKLTTTYLELQSKRLYYDSSKYDGIDNIYFAGFGKVLSGSTGYMELWNVTDSSQLSELSWTESSYTYKKSSPISPTTAKEYTMRAKIGELRQTFTPKNAHIIIDLNNLSKFEADYLIANNGDSSTLGSTNSFVATSHFTGYINKTVGVTKTLYAEMCSKKTSGTGDDGQSRIDDDGGVLNNSTLSNSSGSYARTRSGTAVTEPDDLSELECEIKGYTSSSGDLQLYVQRLILQVSDFDKTEAAEEAVPLRMLMGTGI